MTVKPQTADLSQWCYMNPQDAAAEIERLRSVLSDISIGKIDMVILRDKNTPLEVSQTLFGEMQRQAREAIRPINP